jgi:hypothetical protein
VVVGCDWFDGPHEPVTGRNLVLLARNVFSGFAALEKNETLWPSRPDQDLRTCGVRRKLRLEP